MVNLSRSNGRQPALILKSDPYPGKKMLHSAQLMLFIVRVYSIIDSIMQSVITQNNFDQAFNLLAGRLDLAQTEPVRLVV